MNSFQNKPIIITCLPRSGSTWMQYALCKHKDIHIHGQLPNWTRKNKQNIPFPEWYNIAMEAAKWSVKANNNKIHEVPHYAGTTPEKAHELLQSFMYNFLTGHGPPKKRWGLKGLSTDLNYYGGLWPDAQHVICIRDPWKTVESNKNTFAPNTNEIGYLRGWVNAAKSSDEPNTFVWQIDKMDTEERVERMKKLLRFLKESEDKNCIDFAEKGIVVHKVKPDNKRTYKISPQRRKELLEKVNGLKEAIIKMGYKEGIE